MKTTIEKIPEITIEEYAETNDLEMVVKERELPENDPARFYASFKHCDVKGDGVLIGSFGNGATPEEAIANYGREIHLKTLVYEDCFKGPRREIRPVRIRHNDLAQTRRAGD